MSHLAPAFCENMDKALGTYSFEIPQDMAAGDYTFAWMWIFRDNKQFTSCWEAKIVNSKNERDSILESRNQSLYLPCNDQPLSNEAAPMKIGCQDDSEDNDVIGESYGIIHTFCFIIIVFRVW